MSQSVTRGSARLFTIFLYFRYARGGLCSRRTSVEMPFMQSFRSQTRWIFGAFVACILPLTIQAKEPATLFYLDLANKVIRIDAGGTNSKVIVEGKSAGPDGIAIDTAAGHIYWTNMGKVKLDDGSILRANLDGSNVVTIVPPGGTFTPKQLKIDAQHKKLYWSDREGMRVMRANLDGSNVETLIITGSGDSDRKDASRWCVGIAFDVARGKLYWTQKGGDNAGQGTIKRTNLEIPIGEDAAHRSDIEVLFANLPEPIDMDLDLKKRQMYWTDRGDNTISRAPMDAKPVDPSKRSDRVILVTGLHEVIGIALDVADNRMFYTSLGGELGTAQLNGKHAHMLFTNQQHLTGVAYLEAR
jgi:DNA-binding beta-propeller fold protein YncE